MRLSSRFQKELSTLRSSGKDFAHLNPKLAKRLAESKSDPDVERFLEGLAFLTSRVRDKLDAERPELDLSMIQLLWPQFLRPAPPFTLLTFDAGAITKKCTIGAGSDIHSLLIDGVSCDFKTTTDCDVAPVKIVSSTLERQRNGACLRIVLQSAITVSELNLDRLRLWFCGDASTAQLFYLWTQRYLEEARFSAKDGNSLSLAAEAVRPGGFSTGEMLLPSTASAFRGYQLLQEYFTFPEKFYCIDLMEIGSFTGSYSGTEFIIELNFERPLPPEVKLRPNDIRLFCVPAVNLFKADAEPLPVDHRKVTYPVTIQSKAPEIADEEIFSIDTVISWRPEDITGGRALPRRYPRFESFEHESECRNGATQTYFRELMKPRPSNDGFSHELSFVLHEDRAAVPLEETLSIELTCFNRQLACELAIGDVCIPGDGIPEGVRVENITRPTPPVFPPLDGALDWTLIANLSLNYMTLLDQRALIALMAIYDVLPMAEQRAGQAARKRVEGMVSFSTAPQDRVLHGLPISGLKSVMTLREDCFQTEGDMYLFASIVAEFYRLYTTTNAFHELEVRGVMHGEVYRWPAIIGR